MIELAPERIAELAEAEIAAEGPPDTYPGRALIDSRQIDGGELFFGLPGETHDGGAFAAGALAEGVWGVVVEPDRAAELAGAANGSGWIFSSEDPLLSLQRLARGWRRVIGCPLVGITGSTGKTSAKDITRALMPLRTHASPENYNTEIGLPLALLAAPRETELLVMEMAMRGLGQIEELCEIAEPDVAAITNVGPVHLELLGTLEAIAAAKAEILAGLGERGRAVVPEDAEALEPHLHDDLVTFTFGSGGDVFVESVERGADDMTALVGTPHGEQRFEFGFSESYNLTNALCAIAIGVALDLDLGQMAARTGEIGFSRLRGERVELQRAITIINDCYNANPISMRAAIEHLSERPGPGRRVAILGGMAELGPEAADYHREAASFARSRGVGPVLGVGELARDYAPDEWVADPAAAVSWAEDNLERDDLVLVKGSRSVGLELVTEELRSRIGEAS